MVRLQRIDRRDGTSVFHITLLKELVEDLGWEKGDSIIMSLNSRGDKIEIYKE